MTNATFTTNLQNYSMTKFTQECVKKVDFCTPLKTPPRKLGKNPKKHNVKNGQDFTKMIDDMFAECALPHIKVIKCELGIKNEAMEEELTVKKFAFNIFSVLSRAK